MLRSKLSSFVEILGLNVDVERGLDILKDVSHLFTIKEGFLSYRVILKSLREHRGHVSLVSHSAVSPAPFCPAS